ncbi:MAG TPA: HAMP domain-containing sensor histidine kinase [Polyangiaceae bacterium]
MAAFVAIVASFLAATTFTERRMGLITSASRRLSDESLPAVLEAARMHRELTRLDALVDASSSAPTASDVLARLDDAQRRAAALALPADARKRWAAVEEDLAALRREVTPYVGEERGQRPPEVRAALRERILALSASLDAITEAENARAAQIRRDVQAARAWAGRFTYGLDGVCILLAGAVAVQTFRMQRARRRAVEQHLEDLEDFAVRVAHDIRSPLMPVLLALEKVRARMGQDDAAREVVDRGMRSVHTIGRTVEGLLAFAAAGARPASRESCAVAGTIEAVIAEYLDDASSKSIAIAVECAEPRVKAACSAGVLASVLGNLVGNAIKYMRDAQLRRILVRCWSADGRVHLEVEDSGPGLPPGAAACVFQPYVRADASTRGLGLGLATVKRLVTAHGGSVGVRPAEPTGCVFWIELPEGS